jgi:flavodoxin
MRAVVVYESMYGNTHLIADAIGAGLEAAFDVRVAPVCPTPGRRLSPTPT